MVWHGRPLLISALRKVLEEADQADEVLGIADIQVAAIVAVLGASGPRGGLGDGRCHYRSFRPGGCPALLQALPPVLGLERVAWLPDRVRLRFRPPPDTSTDALSTRQLLAGFHRAVAGALDRFNQRRPRRTAPSSWLKTVHHSAEDAAAIHGDCRLRGASPGVVPTRLSGMSVTMDKL
jgi:hypothetical protein